MDAFYPLIAFSTGFAWLLIMGLGYKRGSSCPWWPGMVIFTIGMVMWNLGFSMPYVFRSHEIGQVANLIVDLGMLLVAAGSIHFAVTLTRFAIGWRAVVAASAYLVSILVFATSRIAALPTSIPLMSAHWPQVISICAVITFVVMLGLEFNELRHARTDSERHRIKYVILATVIAVCGHLADFSLQNGIPKWSLGNVTVMFCGAVVVYAMTSEQLVSLSAMFRNARHTWTAVVLISIGYVVFITTDRNSVRPSLILVPVAVVVSLYIVFVNRDRLFGIIERVLFTERHSLHREISLFETELASMSSPREMASRLLTLFTENLGIRDALIIAAEDIEPMFVTDDENTIGRVHGEHVYALREVRLFKILELVRGPVRLHEIQAESWGRNLGIVFDKSAVEKAMVRMRCELILPLMAGDRLLGAIGLGERESGARYGNDDVRILRELANHVGLYLENARIGYKAEQEDKMKLLSDMADRIVDRLRDRVETLRDTIMRLDYGKPADAADIDTMQREMAHVHDIVEAMRRFARPPAPHRFRCDTNRVIRDVLAKSHWETWFEKVSIETEMEENLPDTFVDPAQIGRIVEAVLLNACESITDRSGTVTITTSAHIESARPHVRIDIADTGAGVKPEDIHKMFEPMYTTKQTHTGVGLSVAYSLLKQNECSISVSNWAEQGGALFTIRCPLWGRPVNTR